MLRRRRRHQLTVGVGISILVHLGLMYYLALHYRLESGGSGPAPVSEGAIDWAAADAQWSILIVTHEEFSIYARLSRR